MHIDTGAWKKPGLHGGQNTPKICFAPISPKIGVHVHIDVRVAMTLIILGTKWPDLQGVKTSPNICFALIAHKISVHMRVDPRDVMTLFVFEKNIYLPVQRGD